MYAAISTNFALLFLLSRQATGFVPIKPHSQSKQHGDEFFASSVKGGKSDDLQQGTIIANDAVPTLLDLQPHIEDTASAKAPTKLMDPLLDFQPEVEDAASTTGKSPNNPPVISKQIESRVLKTVSPFALSRVDSEYLTSVALQLGRYNAYLATASTVVIKLSPSENFRSRLNRAAHISSRVPQIMALIYNNSGAKVEVKENVKTVTKLKSGERKLDPKVMLKASVERMAYLVLEDLNNVREGIYPLPSELKLSNQVGPRVLPTMAKQLYDGLNFALQDSYVGNADYSTPNKPSPYLKELAADLDLPDYYLIDYHSVPAGFLSPKHPPVYDLISEAVFGGTHFMARRMTMRPLAKEMKKRGSQFRNGRGMKLLDLGTGNGSYMIQLQEAFPELELCGIDLSPAMLEYAESSFKRSGSSMKRASLIQGSMTKVPVDDGSYEFVTETNCFHEMPASAISDTAKEVARVLKPGGLFVHLDAVQMKDDPSIASISRLTFDNQFNEPYMLDWMENVDLDEIFSSHGMLPVGPPRPFFASTVRCYRMVRM